MTSAAHQPLLQGTLDLLILHVLLAGPLHGHAIVRRLNATSDEVILVQEGSLYPALHRLAARGHVVAEWGPSENNRRARHYALTKAGRRQLQAERASWERLATAIGKVLTGPEPTT